MVYFFLASSSSLIDLDWKKGDRSLFVAKIIGRDGHIGTYIYTHRSNSVHKCHIRLIFSPGKYPFFEEYSERYLPYFRHLRDVTPVYYDVIGVLLSAAQEIPTLTRILWLPLNKKLMTMTWLISPLYMIFPAK
jgi:hypothetical protein